MQAMKELRKQRLGLCFDIIENSPMPVSILDVFLFGMMMSNNLGATEDQIHDDYFKLYCHTNNQPDEDFELAQDRLDFFENFRRVQDQIQPVNRVGGGEGNQFQPKKRANPGFEDQDPREEEKAPLPSKRLRLDDFEEDKSEVQLVFLPRERIQIQNPFRQQLVQQPIER